MSCTSARCCIRSRNTATETNTVTEVQAPIWMLVCEQSNVSVSHPANLWQWDCDEVGPLKVNQARHNYIYIYTHTHTRTYVGMSSMGTVPMKPAHRARQ